MPIEMRELVDRLSPTRTVLVLGAGASVPSGAPTGAALATRLWQNVAKKPSQSDDLVEVASILARRHGRRAVVDEVVSALQSLKPTGGLLALPAFGWKAVYTTNFDRLWEEATRIAGVPGYAIRSNYDWTSREAFSGTPLYKIHGCITQDESLGHKASMILTEQDYEDHPKYRQILFSSLETHLLEEDALVVGQSLRDRHLYELVKRVLQAKQKEGARGNVFVLVYDQDDLRAPLFEDKGAKIVFGSIDEMSHAIAYGLSKADKPEAVVAPNILQLLLLPTVIDYDVARSLPANVNRMFNGGAATAADIEAGTTFERLRFRQVLDQMLEGKGPVSLVGAGGVGKTTFARQILCELSQRGNAAWEHHADFPFNFREWIAVEARLRSQNRVGYLLLDECTRFMRPVNQLVEHLAGLKVSNLRLILTANSAQWTVRLKSPQIFRTGVVIELSRLDDAELNSLINLLENNGAIRELVTARFKQQARHGQFATLRQRCSADMYVCLKNIFANENLDLILLREYDVLPESSKDYYRYVSALQAVGARVHRQLVIRMLDIPPDNIQYVLDGLKGIVDEYDISPKDGIYGWSTRHLVIARKITEYKFSSAEELVKLFERVIDNLNPSVKIELQSVRDICDNEFGIGRLGDSKERQKLYRRLIAVTPGERIPRHRLCREILVNGDPEDAEQVILDAEEAVGSDAPLDRFKVRLLMARAQKTLGIPENDRLALIRKAYELATRNIGRHKDDKFTYYTLCEVALEAVRRGENNYLFVEAFDQLKVAAERILDPDMDKRARRLQDEYSHLC